MELHPTAASLLRKEIIKAEHRAYFGLKLTFDLIHNDFSSPTREGRQMIFGTIAESVDAAYAAIVEKAPGRQGRFCTLFVLRSRCFLWGMNTVLSIRPEHTTHKNLNKDLEIQTEDYSKRWIRHIYNLSSVL